MTTAEGITVRFAYDAAGQLECGYDLTIQRNVTGKVTEYTYNALDLIEKMTDNGTVAVESSYYPNGSIRSLKTAACIQSMPLMRTRT